MQRLVRFELAAWDPATPLILKDWSMGANAPATSETMLEDCQRIREVVELDTPERAVIIAAVKRRTAIDDCVSSE
jgi:hypothetical protein